MFSLLEMRVRKADEDLGKLVASKEVGEEFHGVGADGGNVLVGSWNDCGGRCLLGCR